MNFLLMNESYECHECGNRFDFPRKIRENYEVWGGIYYDEYEVCPICGSPAFDVVDINDEDNEDDEEFDYEI